MIAIRIRKNSYFGAIFFTILVGVLSVLAGANGASAKIPESLRIIDVSKVGKNLKSQDVGLSERIKVTIEGAAGAATDTNNFSFSSLILYLDDRPLPDHKPAVSKIPALICIELENAKIAEIEQERRDLVTQDNKAAVANADERLKTAREKSANCPDTIYLFFQLTRNQDDVASREVWSALTGSPAGFNRVVNVSVGLPSGKRILPRSNVALEIKLEMLGSTSFWVSLAIFLSALTLFLWLCKASRILCDAPGLLSLSNKEKPPYSLGKTQMAWWFFLILGSYLFIAVATLNYETISAQALILIGIAAGTGLGSIAIDSTKTATESTELENASSELARLMGHENELINQHKKLKEIVVATPEQAAQIISFSEELSEAEQTKKRLSDQIEKLTESLRGRTSKNFIMDIVSDHSGVSFHRFQNVVWSIVLGGAFVFQVWSNLAMPEFSTELLTLMGITSGTYLGFKFPEKK